LMVVATAIIIIIIIIILIRYGWTNVHIYVHTLPYVDTA
jgi:hypothetical protein